MRVAVRVTAVGVAVVRVGRGMCVVRVVRVVCVAVVWVVWVVWAVVGVGGGAREVGFPAPEVFVIPAVVVPRPAAHRRPLAIPLSDHLK
jgi:hypothetical protein